MMFLFSLVVLAGSFICRSSAATRFPNVLNASGVMSSATFAAICFRTESFCSSMSDSDFPLHFTPLGLDSSGAFLLAVEGDSSAAVGDAPSSSHSRVEAVCSVVSEGVSGVVSGVCHSSRDSERSS